MRTNVRSTSMIALLAGLALPAEAAMNETPRRIPSVPYAFEQLAPQGDWLGYHPRTAPITYWPRPGLNTDQHYQGIARSPRLGGPPVLYVTRSGEAGGGFNTGTLQVVRMGTRDGSGERMRSNRLLRDAETQSTIANGADEVVGVIRFDYGHPGAIQMCGDVLAVPLEAPDPDLPDLPQGRIVFFDCQDPLSPRLLPVTVDFTTHDVGVMGLTRLPDGHFLLVSSWGDGEQVDFMRSTTTSFLDPDFDFASHASLGTGALFGSGYWRTGKTTPQTLNLLVQEDGRVFMIGSSNHEDWAPFVLGDDGLYLWEVTGFEDGGALALRAHASTPRSIDLRSEGDPFTDPIFGRLEADFNGGAGAYVTPAGELLYYAVEHYNEGPGQATRFAELRPVAMSRTDTCGAQLRTNHLGGPWRIAEGGSLRLEGRVTFIEPWATMFTDPGFAGSMLTMDAIDQDRDDYADFEKLDGEWSPARDGFSDDMASFMFCAEPGTSLSIFDDDAWRTGDTPTIEVAGTGSVVRYPIVTGGVPDEATSARFHLDGLPYAMPWHPSVRTYEWDLDGDGTFESAGVDGGHAADFTASAPGTYTVSMRIAGVTASTTIEVVDELPTVHLAPIAPSAEGAAVLVEGSWSDASSGPHELTVDWGDGTTTTKSLGVSDSGTFSPSHVYADDGTYDVTACVGDQGAFSCRTETVSVGNVAPVVRMAATPPAGEGALVVAKINFNDRGTLDTHVASVDWGDGLPPEPATVTETPAGPPGRLTGLEGSARATHVYADDGSYVVRVCVEDDERASSCLTRTVTITNSAPSVTRLPDVTTREGRVVSLTAASFMDAGTLDTHVATLEWGDGTPVEPASVTETPYGPPGSPFGLRGTYSGDHVYADDGAYDVQACVTDDDGGVDCQAFRVIVDNAAPAVDALPDLRSDEGLVVGLVGAGFTDPGTLDTHVATVDWGDGTPVDAAIVDESPFGPPGSEGGMSGTFATDHVYADDGTYVVRACVEDDERAAACTTFRVVVANVAPVVGPMPDVTSVEAMLVTLAAAPFHDAGTLDTHSATVDWGDELPAVAGVVTESPYGPPGSLHGLDGSVSSSHVHGDDGAYVVEVCVTDDDGATGCGSFRVIVANTVPSASLDLTGQVAFPGGSAFVARVGVATAWNASAQDAGSDDLRFGWSATDGTGANVLSEDVVACNDPTGATCPDPPQSSQSHHFPMLASDGSTPHAFGQPGALDLGLVVADDDGGRATAGAVLLVTGDARCGHGTGGWKRAVADASRSGATDVVRLLEVVAFASPSFPELACGTGDHSCLLQAAEAALDGRGVSDSRRARAWRASVSAWLDFASGAVAWDQEIRPTGLRFSELVTRVELVLADPSATNADLGEVERLANAVNESVAGQGGCGRD